MRVVLTTGFDRQVTDPLLAAVGWRVGDRLDAVVCASEVAAGRPTPHMIHGAMELTGVTDPAEVLVAGDTALYIRAGHAARAGIVVGVLTGAQTRDELTAERPTHILEGVSELPAVLRRSRPSCGCDPPSCPSAPPWWIRVRCRLLPRSPAPDHASRPVHRRAGGGAAWGPGRTTARWCDGVATGRPSAACSRCRARRS
ncbi:HAD family hydrolase [Streptomyces sp. NPDC050842]|uniref:HAD family hydrolase n=1 Tax=Streptomyces sp. NPDC050842 TaxID=3365636 RepID=UPI0037A9B4D6